MGFSVRAIDPLSDPSRLRALLANTDLVVNMAGPYCKTGTDYLDISDDADVSIPMLERPQAAERAGIRAAVNKLGPVDDVDIYWTVDVNDLTEAAIRHFWHCFNLVDQNGNVSPVAGWDELDFRDIEFPEPVGRQRVVRLAHPEPITVPRFLPVRN